MKPASRDWSSAERREVLLMALLPPSGAALLTLLLFPASPRAWFLAFVIATVCAYVSMFVGVVPLLLLSRRLMWRGWYHYAGAGFLGVLLLWLVPALTLGGFERTLGSQSSSATSSSAIAFLMLPAAIASIAAVVFWLACVRPARPRNGI